MESTSQAVWHVLRATLVGVFAVGLVIAMAAAGLASEGVVAASSGANWIRIIGVVGLIGARLAYGAGWVSRKRRERSEIHVDDGPLDDDSVDDPRSF